MKKYLVLYQAPASAMEQMGKATPEQQKAGMELWMAWSKKAGTAIVDLGQPCGAGKKVANDGKVGDGTTQVRGYSVLQAETLDAVTRLMEGHPHLKMPGGTIEVLETLPIM